MGRSFTNLTRLLGKLFSTATLYFLSTILVCTPPADADESYKTYDTPRFTLHIGTQEETEAVANPEIDDLAETSLTALNNTYEELGRIFKVWPARKVVLRFLSPEEFRRQTGAPAWTSAMYYRGEISIPLTASTISQGSELERALRHEYVHAFLAEISGHRCPAWLDEGVAQLIEGQPNPLLGPALRKWIKTNPAIPLSWLRNGFTMLENSVVPAAYAQSLFATRSLVNRFGFGAVKEYLTALRVGASPEDAFQMAFNLNQGEFETSLTDQIRRWKESNQLHP